MATTHEITRSPLFVVRCTEMILGAVCFILVTWCFIDVEVEATPFWTESNARWILVQNHVVTVATLAYPFITLSTIVTHLMSPGQDVFKHLMLCYHNYSVDCLCRSLFCWPSADASATSSPPSSSFNAPSTVPRSTATTTTIPDGCTSHRCSVSSQQRPTWKTFAHPSKTGDNKYCEESKTGRRLNES